MQEHASTIEKVRRLEDQLQTERDMLRSAKEILQLASDVDIHEARLYHRQ